MNKYISLAVIATCVTFSACNNEKAAESTENTTLSVSEPTTATLTDTTTTVVAGTTPTAESNPDATTTTTAKTETTKAPSTRVINGKAYTAKQLEQAMKTDENLAFDVAMKQQADPQFQIWYDEGTNAIEKVKSELAQSTADLEATKELTKIIKGDQ